MKATEVNMTQLKEKRVGVTSVTSACCDLELMEFRKRFEFMEVSKWSSIDFGFYSSLKRASKRYFFPETFHSSHFEAISAKHSILLFTLILATIIVFVQQGFSQTSSTPFTANGTFNKPSGVTGVTVEAWGGGGAGGGTDGSITTGRYAGGGAGGAFQRAYVNTPNASYAIEVGVGGLGVYRSNGSNGGNSTFGGTLVVALGGEGGKTPTTSNVGAGGGTTSGTFNGGAGAAGNDDTDQSGAGGGGAGNNDFGDPASGTTGGTGGTGYTAGTTGGNGAAGRGDNGDGYDATALSAGGGGARQRTSITDRTGGDGYRGQVIVYYYQLTSVTATTPVCVGSASTITVNSSSLLLSVNYSVTYSLSGANTATNQTASMTGTDAGSRTFSIPATLLTSSGTTTVTITKITNGTYEGGIGASNSANIVVNASPTTATNGSTQSICTYDAAILAGNNPSVGTGEWTVVSGPSTTPAQFASITTYNTTFTPSGGIGSYVIRWTISNSPCPPSYADATITVQSTSSAPAITGTYCAGGTSVTGTSSEADGTGIIVYKAGTTLIGTASVSGGAWTATVGALAASDVITATATAGGKCVSATSSGVTVNPLPTFSILQTNVSCNGGNDGSIKVTVLSGTPNYEFSKNGGNDWTTPQAGTEYTFGSLTVAGGPYNIRVRDGNQCVATNCQP